MLAVDGLMATSLAVSVVRHVRHNWDRLRRSLGAGSR